MYNNFGFVYVGLQKCMYSCNQSFITNYNISKKLKQHCTKGLCHNICRLVFCGYVFDVDDPGFIVFADEVVFDVDVLGAFACGVVACDINACGVVLPYEGWCLNLDTHGFQQHCDPDDFF